MSDLICSQKLHELETMLNLAESISFPGQLNAGIQLLRGVEGVWVVRDWSKAKDEKFTNLLDAFKSIRTEAEAWQRSE